jgi:hypothetical protein
MTFSGKYQSFGHSENKKLFKTNSALFSVTVGQNYAKFE